MTIYTKKYNNYIIATICFLAVYPLPGHQLTDLSASYQLYLVQFGGGGGGVGGGGMMELIALVIGTCLRCIARNTNICEAIRR